MSNYSIVSEIQSGWKIRQDWTKPPESSVQIRQLIYQTFDSKVDNNKPNVKTYLNLRINNNELLKTEDKERRDISFNMQKKRSGDYLQIWFAKKIPDIMTGRLGEKEKITFVRGSPSDPKPTLIEGDIDYYKKNTFFITGDWPAFSYAVYNKVNSVIIVRNVDETKSYMIRAWFP
jgi:hypothetical protein